MRNGDEHWFGERGYWKDAVCQRVYDEVKTQGAPAWSQMCKPFLLNFKTDDTALSTCPKAGTQGHEKCDSRFHAGHVPFQQALQKVRNEAYVKKAKPKSF